MALATKCPQCGALFRVVADQLKLRGGLVRCGECRAVFDAIGSLTYLDDAALAHSRSVPNAGPAAAAPPAESEDAAGARQALGPSTTLRISPIAPATLAGTVAPRIELPKPPPEEPALVRRRAKEAARARAAPKESTGQTTPAEAHFPTLVAPDAAVDAVPAEAATAETMEAVEAAPPRGDTAAEEAAPTAPTPSFVRPKRQAARGFSVVFGGGSALLALLALVQFAVIFRTELVMHWPQSRPLLLELCEAFRCTVGWPTRADQLAVIGTELQAIAGTDALELTAVLRNRAGFRQALPAVEVTLTDSRNRALARKVFSPADYLASAGEPSTRLQEGMAPGSDFTIRIFFEARGVAPAGFLVYPFYL